MSSDDPDLTQCLTILDQQIRDCGYIALDRKDISGFGAALSRDGFASTWNHHRCIKYLDGLVGTGPCKSLHDVVISLHLSEAFHRHLAARYSSKSSADCYTKFISFGQTFWLIRREGHKNFYTLHMNDWMPIFFSKSPASAFIFAGLTALREKVLKDAGA